MSATFSRIVLGAVALSLCVACERSSPSRGGDSASPSAAQRGSATASGPTTTARAEPPKRRKTESASISIRNIEAEIPQLEKQLALTPTDLAPMEALMNLSMVRASRLGRISELDRVVALGEEAVKVQPKRKQAWLMRAKARGAVHRFADALADLEQAEQLGADRETLEAARSTLYVALGRCDDALPIVAARRKQRPSFETFFAEALVLGHMARYAEADALFEGAVEQYRGVSPFPLAHLDFERGVMWDRAGNAEKATTYYRAAVERVPQFAHAAGHLAYKLEHAEAVALVERVITESDDPEYTGALGYLLNQKAPGSGDALVQAAKPRYAALLAKHPLAFADHAGWFYVLIAGEPDKAIEVAEMNLENRPTPEAFELMLAALTAARHGTEACEVADRAVALKYPTVALWRRAASAYELCGRGDEAAELRQRATKN